jgi:hypothetical protein
MNVTRRWRIFKATKYHQHMGDRPWAIFYSDEPGTWFFHGSRSTWVMAMKVVERAIEVEAP